MWKVFLNINGKETAQQLELNDAKAFFGGYLRIKRSYFNELAKNIKMTKKYSTGNAIEKVIAPDNSDWTLNPWMLIIVKDTEKGKPFWFFIKREKDLSGHLIAIGPEQFAEFSKNDSEPRRRIKQIINYIITYINKFNVIILFPLYLT
ncbi:MAG: hypothetical protein EU539_03640 [Promethearchaeota archaeon]|nr:MAG: hypothetical protein EU539_03640 [Candidatus Lokiarchaeota archaeon]